MSISRRDFTALGAAAMLTTGCLPREASTATPIEHMLAHSFVSVEGRGHADEIQKMEGGKNTQVNRGQIFAFPGTKLKLSVPGSYCKIDYMAGSPLVAWDVRIDDGPWQTHVLNLGRSSLILSENMTAPHVITLIKRTEAWQGDVNILGVVSNAEFSAPPSPPKRKLLFIGDSITCGANSELSGEDGISGEIISNARLSYGRILGDMLNAQVHLVAYGGKGLVRDWQGLTNEVTAPQYFERALPDDPNSVWDHSQYVPDAIGVCLGQNDFNQGIPDRESWVGTYVSFLRRIRETAPKAAIFVINSPMSRDDGPRSKGGALLSYLDEIVKTAGNPLILRADVSHYPGVTPTDGHPSTASHSKIANELLPAFTKVF